jgi:hypothetical protein
MAAEFFRRPVLAPANGLAEVLFWAGLLNVCAAHNDWANANFECGLQLMALSRHPLNHLFYIIFLRYGRLAQSLNILSSTPSMPSAEKPFIRFATA